MLIRASPLVRPPVTPCADNGVGLGDSCTLSSGSVTVPNAVSVTETAYRAHVICRYLREAETYSERHLDGNHARPMPYTFALVVDSTLSMNDTDSNCRRYHPGTMRAERRAAASGGS